MKQILTTLWKSNSKSSSRLRLLVISVLILLGLNFLITYQLYNDIPAQQKLIDESYLSIRNIVDLQHSNLQLVALLKNGERRFNYREYIQQVELVDHYTQQAMAPLPYTSLLPQHDPYEFRENLQKHQEQWAKIRPFVVKWGREPNNSTLRQILLEFTTNKDTFLSELNQIAEANFLQQLTNAKLSTRETLQQLTTLSIIWTMLLALLGNNIAGFIRRQRRNEATLRKAKEAVDTASNAKSTFLANMSHEIRTPMNAIVGMATLAIDNAESIEQRKSLEAIKNSSDDLLYILNDILHISSMDTGELKVNTNLFKPAEVVNRIYAQFSEKVAKKGLLLTIHIDEDVPTLLLGDEDLLHKVLAAIVSNALKFTSSGTISIHLSIKPCGQHRNNMSSTLNRAITLQWVVQDTGIGIPKEKHRSIFEPFQQVDNSNTRSYGGCGLGLTLCKQLVELMNGEIHLESDEVSGSKFYFTTPLELPTKQPNSIKTHPSTSTIGTEILVVDDNLTNQKVMMLILQRAGFEVELAENGIEALQKMDARAQSNKQFDLILMDLQMPQMDGFDATMAIRAKEANTKQHIPIIAVTANAMNNVQDECLQAGMNDFLTKPVKPDLLLSTIQRFISQTSASSQQILQS